MAGLLIFPNIESAVAAGFTPYDRNSEHWIVRTTTPKGQLAMALAKLSNNTKH